MFMPRSVGLVVALTPIAASGAEFMWNFNAGDLSTTSQVGGTAQLDYFNFETQAVTQFGNTASNPNVPDLPDGPASYVFTGVIPNDGVGGYGLSYTGVTGNGGGIYVNDFTFIFDVFIPTLNWTPFFNTNESHNNDADWYVAPDGRLGIGSIGYAPAGTVASGEWTRLAFVRDRTNNIVKYYKNGVEVFSGAAGSVDGRFSLYTSSDGSGPSPASNSLIIYGEGDTSGNYTNDIYTSSIFFADSALSPLKIGAMGGPRAAGIALPLLGDIDGSGQVNNQDIAPFVEALTNTGGSLSAYVQYTADVNGDGSVNNQDIAPFVALLTTPGLLQGSDPELAPLMSLVPEPASLSLLALACLPLRRRR